MKEYIVEVYDNGDKFWHLNGQLHREDDLPAVECADGYKAWYLNNKRHREDGPAMERANGDTFWFLNGVELTEEEFLSKTNKPKNAKLIKCLKQVLECLEEEK